MFQVEHIHPATAMFTLSGPLYNHWNERREELIRIRHANSKFPILPCMTGKHTYEGVTYEW
jgi:hypothetical protein